MASAQDIQILLRFLSQDAKVPLAQAMSKVKDLQSAHLITPTDIAKAEFDHLNAVFSDEKLTRQVLNAAKRASKKRTASEVSAPAPQVKQPVKKTKQSYGEPLNPAAYEASLALPGAAMDESALRETVVWTNRAPLVIAFAVTLLKYTMPEQPLSSRLSLAQALCSANSTSKAKSIGLQHGKTAEDEGWGEGQPYVTIMGRPIRVMKRWGYNVKEGGEPLSTQETISASSQGTVKAESEVPNEPALWGLDLEALKKSNMPVIAGARTSSASELPIYRPESARAYLLKSFQTKPPSQGQPTAGRKKANAENEENLGKLLAALDMLYLSWAHMLGKDDLDKRAWGWYCSVRPEVKAGVAGWGGKGNVKLVDILGLRRPAG